MTPSPIAGGESASRLSLDWLRRADPLEPSAALGRGETAIRLAKRLIALSDPELAKLEAVASARLLVVVGPSEVLPWVDGIEYFGRDPEVPLLLLPTALAPSVPPAWLARAFAKRLASALLPGLALVAPDPPLLVPLAGRLGLTKSALERWLGEHARPAAPTERGGTS